MLELTEQDRKGVLHALFSHLIFTKKKKKRRYYEASN